MNSVIGPRALQAAKKSIEIQTAGMEKLRAALDAELGDGAGRAIGKIHAARGQVVVSGMGKSGHIGRKIAATLASTGTPVLLPASRRGQPWRPRHGDAGRCGAGLFLVGRNRRARRPDRLFQAFRRALARRDLAARQRARPRRRRPAAAAAGRGGLPQRPRADDLDHHPAGAGRRAGRRFDRGSRLFRPGFPHLPSRRQARRRACTRWTT